MLFSLLKLYLHTDTALKVSQSVYCFTTSISCGAENYFSRLCGTDISDAIFFFFFLRRRQYCNNDCYYSVWGYGEYQEFMGIPGDIQGFVIILGVWSGKLVFGARVWVLTPET